MPVLLKSNENDEDVIIELVGHLDEAVKFPQISARLSQRIIFECDELKHVSSAAAQTWSRWMLAFPSDQQYVFRKVRPRVIHLFNVFTGFLPKNTTMETFYLPYECEKCGKEELWLARRGREYIESIGDQPAKMRFEKELNCPNCKGRMTLGFWEDKYLGFLQLNDTKIVR